MTAADEQPQPPTTSGEAGTDAALKNHGYVPPPDDDADRCARDGCDLPREDDIHQCAYKPCGNPIPYTHGRGRPRKYCAPGGNPRRWPEQGNMTCRELRLAAGPADDGAVALDTAQQNFVRQWANTAEVVETVREGIVAETDRILNGFDAVLDQGESLSQAIGGEIMQVRAVAETDRQARHDAEAARTEALQAKARAEQAADKARSGEKAAVERARETEERRKADVASERERAIAAEQKVAVAEQRARDAENGMAEAHQMREHAVAEARTEVEAGLARETGLQHDITRLTAERDTAQSQISVTEERAEAAVTTAREDAAAAVAAARQREDAAEQRAQEATATRDTALEGKASAEAAAAVAEARTGEIRTQLRISEQKLKNRENALGIARNRIRALEAALRAAGIDTEPTDDTEPNSDPGGTHD